MVDEADTGRFERDDDLAAAAGMRSRRERLGHEAIDKPCQRLRVNAEVGREITAPQRAVGRQHDEGAVLRQRDVLEMRHRPCGDPDQRP
jgi:hypothetical protein